MTPAPLFASSRYTARELSRSEMPLLQALFDANPAYFQTVNGRDAHADEALQEYDELPPPHLPFAQRWFAGLFDRSNGELVGVAIVLADLGTAGVWHLSLFLVASRLHGSGAAHEIHGALEGWVRRNGAQWLRLGVVRGNARAERFWQRAGYVELRVREGIDTGGRLNTVRVMLKPLAGGTPAQYLEQVPRDRPDSDLP